jgi:hypothetical protein
LKAFKLKYNSHHIYNKKYVMTRWLVDFAKNLHVGGGHGGRVRWTPNKFYTTNQ